MMTPMWSHGLIGFIIGFAVGMAVNAYLLRGVPRAEYFNNKKLRTRYGALNWAIAIFGMIIGLAIGRMDMIISG